MALGKIVAVCVSKKKGTTKTDVCSGIMIEGFGLQGDAHGGDWHRQVSLLGLEHINKMLNKGFDVKPGSFAENLTTEGIVLETSKIGDRIRVGDSVVLEVTQIGKECHTRCAIYNKIGECIMPEKGVFARIVKGGPVSTGDEIEVI
jgi:MOSC domain-containing protein YiiM